MASNTKYGAEPHFPAEKQRSAQAQRDAVDARSQAWSRQRKAWDLIDDLRAGTERMREVGRKWLPQEEAEKPAAYQRRLDRSVLYGALDDTIKNLVSKPFSKPVSVNGDLPEQLVDLEDDVDHTGRSLTSFGADVLDSAVEHGMAGIWVDFPETAGTIQNLQQERSSGVRPTMHLIDGDRIIGYRGAMNTATGKMELSEIRFVEWRTEQDGEYGDVDVELVRIIRGPSGLVTDDNPAGNGTWELWRRDPREGRWEQDDSGTHTYPGVPVVMYYTDEVGFMEARPPLLDLAYLNLEHWQKKSDLDWAIHHSAFPMLFIKGLTKEERDRTTQIGPTRTFKSTNERADMKWVEMVGGALEQGQNDIERLEARMEVMGVEPLVDKVTTTATGKHQQSQRRGNQVQEWVRDLETAFKLAYEMAARWVNAEITDEEFGIDIFSDFGITMRGAEDLDRILAMRQQRLITHETTLREVKRRGTLSESFDVEAEIEALEAESEDLAGMGLNPLTGEPLEPEVPEEDDEDEEDDDEDTKDTGRSPVAGRIAAG